MKRWAKEALGGIGWALAIGGTLAAIWLMLHLSGCGGSGSPTRQAIRTAASMVAALCPAQATVEECVTMLEEDEGRLEQFVRPSDAGAE